MSWRAWHGEGFNLSMPSPHAANVPEPVCAGLAPGGGNSITYNSYVERDLAVTNSGPPGTGYPGCGFYLALSILRSRAFSNR